MKNLLIFLASVSIVILVGCPRRADDHPAVYIPIDTNMCGTACARMDELKCEAGTPIDVGKLCKSDADCTPDQFCSRLTCKISCEVFCRQSQASGVWLNPMCISSIKSCEEIDTVCYVGRPKN